MGKKPAARQPSPMWVTTADLPTSAGHPFFERLNRVLEEAGFDAFVEGLCAVFYASRLGRPSLRPGRYFRLLFIGYFEGLSSERGIAWRVADSLRAWRARDAAFPFVDSHEKNYNVRDGSDWERTLQPRIRDRLRNSKNIILFLSSITKNSRALREEVDYGITSMALPVIVVYPDFSKESDIIGCASKTLRKQIQDLWDKLPRFRDSMPAVPTLHVPNKQSLIKKALQNDNFKVQTKGKPGAVFYPC